MATSKQQAVLIVEDERIVAMDLQQTLVELGYDAFAIASSADEALSRAADRCPDVVLMDIRIKGQRDGIETAALLRERFDVPVVYLTAHADEATLDRAKLTEPYGYLMKPVNTAELRSIIEVAIYKHGMEKRLRGRESTLSTTLASIADAVITVDLAGNVTFMNPAAETLTEVASELAIGRPVRDIVGRLGTAEKQPAGTRRMISEVSSPVMENGELRGAVMVLRDVTDRRLQQSQRELADRLASLGTMAAGIAHEVNNPLAVVMANASYVLDELRRQQQHGYDDAGRLAEATRAQSELEAAAIRIATVVAKLQAFSMPSPPVAGDADVAAAIAWAIRSTAPACEGRVATKLGTPRRVKIDETRLGQLLANLLLNAAAAIEPIGSIAIETSARGENVVIEVRDTGCGIATDALKRVFEPFYSTRAPGAGLGLGLAICHGIAISAGGSIEVESVVGAGSTVRVTLPAAASAHPPKAVLVAALRRGRILAIDDEQLMLRAIRRMLGDHEVVCIGDANEALVLLDRGEDFDLILCDVTMPLMSGMQLYECLLTKHPVAARKLVFLSGGAVNARTAEFLTVVRNPRLTKPIFPDVLRGFVQEYLASHA